MVGIASGVPVSSGSSAVMISAARAVTCSVPASRRSNPATTLLAGSSIHLAPLLLAKDTLVS
jgi:hypothetical protein